MIIIIICVFLCFPFRSSQNNNNNISNQKKQ